MPKDSASVGYGESVILLMISIFNLIYYTMLKPAPTIRDLYPHFTDEQLAEAENAHEQYLEIVQRIFERLESEGVIDAILKSSSTI